MRKLFKCWLIYSIFFIQNLVSAFGPDMPCKDFVNSMTKAQMTGIKECSKSMTFKDSKDKSAKMNCTNTFVLLLPPNTNITLYLHYAFGHCTGNSSKFQFQPVLQTNILCTKLSLIYRYYQMRFDKGRITK